MSTPWDRAFAMIQALLVSMTLSPRPIVVLLPVAVFSDSIGVYTGTFGHHVGATPRTNGQRSIGSKKPSLSVSRSPVIRTTTLD